jgi:hypothetical protein
MARAPMARAPRVSAPTATDEEASLGNSTVRHLSSRMQQEEGSGGARRDRTADLVNAIFETAISPTAIMAPEAATFRQVSLRVFPIRLNAKSSRPER